ncbi:Coiled-coil domain-containing protein 57, partial [Clarias magur]
VSRGTGTLVGSCRVLSRVCLPTCSKAILTRKTSSKEESWNIYDEPRGDLQEAIFDRRRAQALELWKENKSRLRRLAPA